MNLLSPTSVIAIISRLTFLFLVTSLALPLPRLCAEQSGPFTYRILDDGTVQITDYPTDASGEVVIPAEMDERRVTSISIRAFADCDLLTSITIPSSVTTIGDEREWSRIRQDAFSDCIGLEAILVEPGNLAYASHQGVLFDASMTGLVRFPPGKAGAYTMPEGVTSISTYFSHDRGGFNHGAFSGCEKLTSVTIPSSLTVIGGSAFRGCTGLTSVTIPDGVTSIGTSAFSNCTSLTSVTIPEGITHIGSYAFYGCTGLASVTIPEGVTSLASGTIPEGVTCIGTSAFSNCTSLTSVTIPEGITHIGSYAFHGCTSLASVTIPEGVTSIGNYVFDRCTGLTGVLFLGSAPTDSVGSFFFYTAPEFTTYYLSTSTGFTSPTWNGYPAVEIDVEQHPAAPWLLGHGLPLPTELHQDLNGDGVSLLMAYALDLDPRQDLRGRLPVPVIDSDSLSLTFPTPRVNLTYTVQTSTDLQSWTTEGVTTSALDATGLRTATVPRDTPQRFLRLVVE